MPIHTVKSNVFTYLEKATQQAHIIFADPPYDFTVDQFANIVVLVFKNELLLEDGWLIIEHSKHTDLSHLDNFSDSKSYGGNIFSFFKAD